MDISGLIPADRHLEGVVEMMLDATKKNKKTLTAERLFGWHSALFPTGRSGMYKIAVGTWRKDDSRTMPVMSGAMEKEKVHFEAPDASTIKKEMAVFINWFNNEKNIDPVIKAAIAHLWFVTLLAFNDGNGRIARAIADMQLAKADGSIRRFYSMSAQIRLKRNAYYNILETTQKGDLDISKWLIWFLECLSDSLNTAKKTLETVLAKANFWEENKKINLNDRQRILINKLWDGFEGNLTTTKWSKITKCSADTALRDITDLINKNILLKQSGGGRSISYELNRKG